MIQQNYIIMVSNLFCTFVFLTPLLLDVPLLYMLVGTWTVLRLRLTDRLLKWSLGCRMNSPPSSTLFPSSSTSLISTALKYSYWKWEENIGREGNKGEIKHNRTHDTRPNISIRVVYLSFSIFNLCYYYTGWLSHLSAESESSLCTEATWIHGSSHVCMLLQWKAAEQTNLPSASMHSLPELQMLNVVLWLRCIFSAAHTGETINKSWR